tara:strand:+ start:105 stop:776 length:672 start_codon:yes stop_codon:yes gene_type:complete
MKTPINRIQDVGYFSLSQCIHSPLAHRMGINNFPGTDYSLENPNLNKDQIILNLHKLFKYCINPIYRKFSTKQLSLTSVYRNKELNKALNGVENSQHIYGYAADIVCKDGRTNTSEIFNWCRKNLPQYHQLIWEYPEKENYKEGVIDEDATMPPGFINTNIPNWSWIHISYIEGNNKKCNSVSSNILKLHKEYEDENTYSIGNFTHKIKEANQELLNELLADE